jgi:hypothetical protein
MAKVRAWDARIWKVLEAHDRPKARVWHGKIGELPAPFVQVLIAETFMEYSLVMLDDIISNGI